MRWTDFMRVASDELIGSGRAIGPRDVVEHALSMPGGQEAFDADRDANAKRKAWRDASAILRETTEANDDERVAELFDGTEYAPPRCITFAADVDGSILHKGIEHATSVECDGYLAVLDGNIRAATRKRFDFGAFLDNIAGDLREHGTVGAALRARRERRQAAA